MKRGRKIALRVVLALLVVLAWAGYRTLLGTPFTIRHLADRQAFLFLSRNPELFSQVGLVDGTILDRHSGRLASVGPERRAEDLALAERFVAEVKRFDRAGLGTQDQITYDILLDLWGQTLETRRFGWLSSASPYPAGLYPVSPMFGGQVQLTSFLQTVHVVKNEKTARNYLRRLEAAEGKLDGLTAEVRRQAGLGVVLPPSLLEKSLAVIADTVRGPAAQNALVATFAERMGKVKELGEPLRRELAAEATRLVEARVYPALERMAAALRELRPAAARTGDGVGRLPDGAAYYALELRQMTTVDDSPEVIHALGLAEVARIEAEMDALLREQGLSRGTPAERARALGEESRFHFPAGEEGAKTILARYRDLLDEVDARMPALFPTLPRQRISVERVPASAEKGSAGAYYQPAAMDGSRPGTFFANLRDTGETVSWAMKTLAYHEGIPGHHFQVAVAKDLEGLPLVRQQTVYAAFAEGWALYAERLAAEIGMYKDDPLGDLGRLQAEIFRAVRLVVDTGIHAKGWSREQAIAYMVAHTGMAETEVTSEVERYMALPGQACAYKVGQLKILALREKARAALGTRFDLEEFHGLVLGSGAMPLTILERQVDTWIARVKGGVAVARVDRTEGSASTGQR